MSEEKTSFTNALQPDNQNDTEIVIEKDVSQNALILNAMKFQQQTILEQQKTINIYAKQQMISEEKPPIDGLGQIAPLLMQLLVALKGGPVNVQ